MRATTARRLNDRADVRAVDTRDVMPVLALHRQHPHPRQRRRHLAQCFRGPDLPLCRLRRASAHDSRYVRDLGLGSAEGPLARMPRPSFVPARPSTREEASRQARGRRVAPSVGRGDAESRGASDASYGARIAPISSAFHASTNASVVAASASDQPKPSRAPEEHPAMRTSPTAAAARTDGAPVRGRIASSSSLRQTSTQPKTGQGGGLNPPRPGQKGERRSGFPGRLDSRSFIGHSAGSAKIPTRTNLTRITRGCRDSHRHPVVPGRRH